jgi:Reverse transcriptase (RNA-dependent DNA polymerase)
MRKLNYFPTTADPCLYVKRIGLNFTIVAVYVDDVFGVSTDPAEVSSFHHNLGKFFEYKELGPLSKVLGMRVEKTRNGDIIVSNSKMIHSLVLQYQVNDIKEYPRERCPGVPGVRLQKPAENDNQHTSPETREKQSNYWKLTGSLMHLSTSFRFDINVAVQDLGRMMTCSTDDHWQAALQVLIYLRDTAEFGMIYYAGSAQQIILSDINPIFTSYADADWAGDVDDRKSLTGIVIQLADLKNYLERPVGDVIYYRCKKQSCISLSTTESEYYALGELTQQVVWLRRLLSELGFQQTVPTPAFQDNQACAKLATSEMLSVRSRHIDVKAHYTRHAVKHLLMQICLLPTQLMRADLFTKNLPVADFIKFCGELGMVDAAMHR